MYFNQTITIPHSILVDLAKDDKVFDVNEVINLDTLKLQVEATGAQIVQQIQEWLLTKVSSSKVATLPEDMTQRMLVGVCSLLSTETRHNHCPISPFTNSIYNISFTSKLVIS